MTNFRTRTIGWIVLAVAITLGATAAAYAASGTRTAGETLVVDRSFEIKTADPQRAFEPTAAIVNRGVFDTLFTYKGSDVAHPVPCSFSHGRQAAMRRRSPFSCART